MKTSLQTNDAVRVLILAHPQPQVLIWREQMQAKSSASVLRNGTGSRASWEAGALRLFRCNFLGEQGGEQGAVFSPLICARTRVGDGGHWLPCLCCSSDSDWRYREARCDKLLAVDCVRRNLAVFHSYGPFPVSEPNLPIQVGTNHHP